MKQDKPNHMVSVDSETGIYWYGKQVVRRDALIKEIIKQEVGNKHEGASRSLLHFAVTDNQGCEKAGATC